MQLNSITEITDTVSRMSTTRTNFSPAVTKPVLVRKRDFPERCH